MTCPNCGFESPFKMKFCGMCGTSLKQICPQCGFDNPYNYRFCGMCGLSLSTELARVHTPLLSVPELASPALPEVAKSTPSPVPLAGERRQATVILADVFGSTDLLERIGTEAWVGIMNDTLQILEAEVYRFGGQVDQFRGDGLVAFFGAAAAHEDDPERAVLAALSMQEAMQTYAAQLAAEKAIELLLRVGVSSGEMIVTSIGGNNQHREDTAMGKGIALAARMETSAEPGTVLVSESTYRRTETQFEWLSIGQVYVKGLNQPVAAYRPLRPRKQAQAGLPYRLQAYGLSTPLIGRESEVSVLKKGVENLSTGHGGIVLLKGDAGVGKSRLVNEVQRHILRDRAVLAEIQNREGEGLSNSLPPLTWLRGRCRSYEQARPYSLWYDLLRNWLGVQEEEPESQLQERLYHRAHHLWGDSLAAHYPYLGVLLSLMPEEPYAERIKQLDAEGLRQQLYTTIRSWLDALAAKGPLVLAFSDVHWADATSLNLLEYCLPLCDQKPILWLIMFRAERTSAVWPFSHRVETEFPHRVTTLTLYPLTEEEIGEMIDRLIGPDVLPAATRNLVIHKAEGNPYYVEELLHSLIEQGVLEQDSHLGGRWRATHTVDSLDLPDTLQSLLLARFDSRPPLEQQILQMAAIIGTLFWSNVLENLIEEPATLNQSLTALQRAQLIDERGRVPDLGIEYSFKSKLFRQVIYETILATQLAIYHRRVADYLEQRFNHEAPAQYYGMLAHHYRQAGEQSKELLYTLLAAAEAREVYANVEALELYSRALDLLNQMEKQAQTEERLFAVRSKKFEVQNERRELFYIMGNFKASRADAQALLPLAKQLADDPIWLIDALLQQPGVAYWANKEELQAGRALAKEALQLAQQLGDQHRAVKALIAIARQAIELSDPAALDYAHQALELARELGDQYTEAEILISISGSFNWSNNPEQGQKYLEEALPLFESLDNVVAEIRLLGEISLHFERLGDYYRVLTEYQQRRLQLSREINHRSLEADALSICGQVEGLYLGNYEAGLALEKEARRIWRDTQLEGRVLMRMAKILTAQGKYDEALLILDRTIQTYGPEANEMALAGLNLTMADLYNALGGEQYLYRALESSQQIKQIIVETPRLSRQLEIGANSQAAVTYLELAKLTKDPTTRQNFYHQALESSQAALEIYERFGYVQIVECVSEEVLFRHYQALTVNGRHQEAAVYLQRAYTEMMRKHDLIPATTPYRQSYLENIALHRAIHNAYTTSIQITTNGQSDKIEDKES